ncbi:TetR family transcriptional regulator C-terminal domain-containing protein [Streptomyces sp. NBC_01525]|uniref:TetR family transcriptional regulator C-terminal domain-containing protein n=1 Tax=Streptomyces sp. NBC_01525 TaxID=2903893 RepID=UPI003867ED75
MSSTVPRRHTRKSPAARRAEIIAAAAAVALAGGLGCITLRRIAEDLGVRPGLIGHCFPSVEELVAEAFGSAARVELDALLPAGRTGTTPTGSPARFFARATGPAYDGVSRLWINARHLSRYHPVLRERVGDQEAVWRERLEALIREGVVQGEFRTDDPYVTMIQILVVIDGLGAHATTGTTDRPESVTRMAVTTAERELGLPPGTPARVPGDDRTTAR